MQERWQLNIQGLVQGVGFRPFCYNLANHFNLTGFIKNTGSSVELQLQGNFDQLNSFISQLKNNPPTLAKIEHISNVLLPVDQSETHFKILESHQVQDLDLTIPTDVRLCQNCTLEFHDPNNRRFRYPFINCTDCGPRYSIIASLPYDRIHTSMKNFAMCPTCQVEYHDPSNRRFHAQPISCPQCGPQLTLFDGEKSTDNNSLNLLIEKLISGKICAIKGIGGYHLALDAKNSEATQLLRQRKNRPDKPFAIMCKDIQAVKKICECSQVEEKILQSNSAPIVLLKKTEQSNILNPMIAPNISTLGVMLPYTPLHLLIFELCQLDYLVMTSANLSGEPIISEDSEAMEKLKNIADVILMHNRPILSKCDDSVVLHDSQIISLRNGRGYAPQKLSNIKTISTSILGVGADLKSTICIANKNQCLMSPYIGDIANWSSFQLLKQTIKRYEEIFNSSIELIIHDAHPAFFSTQLAEKLNRPTHALQHHKAHAFSVLGEHQCFDPVLAICLDGTGYGDDDTIWGGEFFAGQLNHLDRVGSIDSFDIQSSDSMTKQLWKLGIFYLHQLGVEQEHIKKIYSRINYSIIKELCTTKFATIPTSSCGRLFDAVASILRICDDASYEGQGAILLENICQSVTNDFYSYDILLKNNLHLISFKKTFLHLLDEMEYKTQSEISAKFHNTVVEALWETTHILCEKHSLKKIVLSGGCWQNNILRSRFLKKKPKDLEILTPQKIPFNDECISFGQVIYGSTSLI